MDGPQISRKTRSEPVLAFDGSYYVLREKGALAASRSVGEKVRCEAAISLVAFVKFVRHPFAMLRF